MQSDHSGSSSERGIADLIGGFWKRPGLTGHLAVHALLMAVGIAIAYVLFLLLGAPNHIASWIARTLVPVAAVVALGLTIALGRRAGTAAFLLLLFTSLELRSHGRLLDGAGIFFDTRSLLWRAVWINQVAWLLAAVVVVDHWQRPRAPATSETRTGLVSRFAALVIAHAAGFLMLFTFMAIEVGVWPMVHGGARGSRAAMVLYGAAFGACCVADTMARRRQWLFPEIAYIAVSSWAAYKIGTQVLPEFFGMASLAAFVLSVAIGRRLGLGSDSIRTVALSVGVGSLLLRSINFLNVAQTLTLIWLFGLAALLLAPRLGVATSSVPSRVSKRLSSLFRAWQERSLQRSQTKSNRQEDRASAIARIRIVAKRRPTWPRRFALLGVLLVTAIPVVLWLQARWQDHKTRVVDPGEHQEVLRGDWTIEEEIGGSHRVTTIHDNRGQGFGPKVLWSRDGAYLYATSEAPNRLVRFRPSNWEQAGEVTLPSSISDVAACGGYILVALVDAQMVDVVDAASFQVVSRIETPTPGVVQASTDCGTVLVADQDLELLTFLSVSEHSMMKQHLSDDIRRGSWERGSLGHFKSLELSPDGTFLLVSDGRALHRFEVVGTDLRYGFSGHRLSPGWKDPVISNDGRYIAVAQGMGGPIARPDGPAANILVFRTDDLKEEVLGIKTDSREYRIGFDGAAQRIYSFEGKQTRTGRYALGTFSADGLLRARYPLAGERPAAELAVRPQGFEVAFVADGVLEVIALRRPGQD